MKHGYEDCSFAKKKKKFCSLPEIVSNDLKAPAIAQVFDRGTISYRIFPKLNSQLFVVCHHAQALCFTQRRVIASLQHDVDHFVSNESHIQTVGAS